MRRIYYVIFIILGLLIVVLGAMRVSAEHKLTALALERSIGALTDCADALDALDGLPVGDEKRLYEILRFELAASRLGLPDKTALELRRIAVGLRDGEPVNRELAELFARRASSREPTLGLSDELAALLGCAADDNPSEGLRIAADENSSAARVNRRFALEHAKELLERLLPEAAHSVKLHSGDGELYSRGANLSVSFSDFDGEPIELYCIHLGSSPQADTRVCTPEELAERAEALAKGCELLRSLCGFTLFTSGERAIVLDSRGRLWASCAR